MTVGESDVNFQQEKERLAREWLAKLKPVLGLDDDVKQKKTTTTTTSTTTAKNKKKRTTDGGGEKRSGGAKGKYADVSDDDDENDEGVEKENLVKRQREVFYKVWSSIDEGRDTKSPVARDHERTEMDEIKRRDFFF